MFKDLLGRDSAEEVVGLLLTWRIAIPQFDNTVHYGGSSPYLKFSQSNNTELQLGIASAVVGQKVQRIPYVNMV